MKAIHHAVVFEGDTDVALEAATTYVEETLGIPIRQNPDLALLTYERVSIDEARRIKEEASQQPLGHARAFIIVCDSILIEAQNALLKLLEEPAERTHFVLVLPNVETLLPTIRSRLYHAGRFVRDRAGSDATAFLQASYRERMKIVNALAEDKDRVKARELIYGLLALVHMQGVTKNTEVLKDLTLAAEYVQDRSGSIKQILQHVAVVL